MKKMKWRNALIAAALITVPLVLVLAFGFGRDPHAVPFVLKGKSAPEFALERLGGGEPVRLAALRGKPVVLNFWATWCIPCEAEHPVLAWGAKQWEGEVSFLGIIFEDSPEKARAYLQRNGQAYPQLVDPAGRSPVDYGISGVPETFFIDAQGIIRDKIVGPVSPEALAAQIRAMQRPAQEAAAR